MFTLSKKQNIGHYTVTFPVREGDSSEIYRVKDASGKNYCLKLIHLEKLGHRRFNADGDIIEEKILQDLKHPNVVHYIEANEHIIQGRRTACLVTDFISGETLEQNHSRGAGCNPYAVKEWMIDTLAGLQYLHSLPDPIIHNGLMPQNIMLDSANRRAVIIGFGHALHMSSDRRAFDRKGLSPYYLAPEALNGIFSPQSDIFALGVTAYRLLFGQLPWQAAKGEDFDDELQRQRERPLKTTAPNNVTIPSYMVDTIAKALSVDPADRFSSAQEMAKVLNGKTDIGKPAPKYSKPSSITKGKGFADIAGMKELKELLRRDVIDLLKEPEKYKKYGLTLPNGMLLYGPPGCGKTFFAKKLAEEVGFNFLMRTPSDLKSRYVNATQENVAAMFAEAEKSSPSIIFIDEINELIPRRSSDIHELSKGCVNEMLAQMDRTGERGIFVIGATNLPDDIDEAMLRTGRLEKRIYVGPPDKDARREMFEKHLDGRYADFCIDYNKLADLTEGYVSSDIRYIVDEAARLALDRNEKISMSILEDVIRTHPSSLKNPTKSKIGFNK